MQMKAKYKIWTNILYYDGNSKLFTYIFVRILSLEFRVENWRMINNALYCTRWTLCLCAVDTRDKKGR